MLNSIGTRNEIVQLSSSVSLSLESDVSDSSTSRLTLSQHVSSPLHEHISVQTNCTDAHLQGGTHRFLVHEQRTSWIMKSGAHGKSHITGTNLLSCIIHPFLTGDGSTGLA